ncbi:hypothetical protein MASR1M12_01240 [Erysipelotrichia bacterium]
MAFDEETVGKVWEKGTAVPGYDPRVHRKDQCGAWMQFNERGNRNSALGWEIDHITPTSSGGGDQLSNLRPLQWENNVSKSDGRLVCVVVSKGNANVRVGG